MGDSSHQQVGRVTAEISAKIKKDLRKLLTHFRIPI